MIALPVITVHQPYASLIAGGAKTHEFQDRRPPPGLEGKTLAIHASPRVPDEIELMEMVLHLEHDGAPDMMLRREPGLAVMDSLMTEAMPLNALLCVVTLGPALRCRELAEQVGLPSVNRSDLGLPCWAWPMLEVRPFREPIACPEKPDRDLWWTWHVRPEALAAHLAQE